MKTRTSAALAFCMLWFGLLAKTASAEICDDCLRLAELNDDLIESICSLEDSRWWHQNEIVRLQQVPEEERDNAWWDAIDYHGNRCVVIDTQINQHSESINQNCYLMETCPDC